MKLSIAKQLALANVFAEMDSREIVVDGPDGKPKVIEHVYKLGAARLDVIENAEAVDANVAAFHKAAAGVRKETWPDGPPGKTNAEIAAADPDGFAKVRAAIDDLLAAEREVNLAPFSKKLIFEDNEFPSRVGSTLKAVGLIAA